MVCCSGNSPLQLPARATARAWAPWDCDTESWPPAAMAEGWIASMYAGYIQLVEARRAPCARERWKRGRGAAG